MKDVESQEHHHLNLFKDIDWKVRCKAASVLGRISGRWALQTLTGGLLDQDPDVRVAVIDAMGKTGNSGAVKTIILSGATQSSFPQVRTAAANAFGKINDLCAWEPLLELAEDPVWEVRDSASNSIEEIIIRIEEKGIEPVRLKRMLCSTNPLIRDMARKKMVTLGDDAVPYCAESLQSPAVKVRRIAARCLSEISTRNSVQALSTSLTDKDASVRRTAVEAMAKWPVSNALPVITELLADPNDRVRKAAAETLAAAGKDIIPLVSSLAHDHASPGRRELVRVLGKAGGNEMAELLIDFLGDPSFIVRRETISIISSIDKFPLKRLIDIVEKGHSGGTLQSRQHNEDTKTTHESEAAFQLKEREIWKIAGAISVLGIASHSPATGCIVRALNIPDSRIQTEAVISLGKFKTPKVFQILKKVLNHKDMPVWVKENALRSLLDYSSEEREFAQKFLQHEDVRIRREAVRVLSINPPSKSLPSLKKRLKDTAWSVRQEAGFAVHNAGISSGNITVV